MGIWSRSWKITKLTFDVMKKDKEMLLFPILGFIFSLIFMFAILFPTIVIQFFSAAGVPVFGALEFLMLFITYLGLAFITVFFNVAVVYTTKTRLEGGDATFGDSFKFAFSKIHLIFAWSLVAATVGLILRLIDKLGEKLGTVGEIIVKILTSILGMVWSIITVFVVPVMVYEGTGPFKSIKTSFEVLKKTWGEQLIRHFGLGFVQAMFILAGILVGLLVGIPLFLISPWTLVFTITLFIVYIVGVALVFSVANSVYNTALYVYGTTGKVPAGYDDESMRAAFKSKKIGSTPSYSEPPQL